MKTLLAKLRLKPTRQRARSLASRCLVQSPATRGLDIWHGDKTCSKRDDVALSRCLAVSVLVMVLTGASATAQNTPITIRAGRLIDGAGGVSENARITLDGPRIASVDRLRGAVTYDLSDLTVMPGWIDTHVHLTNHFDADGRNHSDPDETPEQAILYAVENAYRTLMAGFTTVQSLGSPRDRDLRDAIARGHVPGPRVLTSLRAVNARTGTPDEIRAFVRQLDADGADVVKIFASASIREGGGQVMTDEQLQELISDVGEIVPLPPELKCGCSSHDTNSFQARQCIDQLLGQPLADLGGDVDGVINRQRAPLDPLLERLSLVVRHHEVQLAVVGLVDLVDRADVGVVEGRGRLGFLQEPLLGRVVAGQIRGSTLIAT